MTAPNQTSSVHNGVEVGGGSSDGRAPVSGDERGRTPQQAARRSEGPGFDSRSPLASPNQPSVTAETRPCAMCALADNARLRAQVAHLTDRLAVAQRVATRLRQQLDQATATRGQEPTTAWGDPRPSVAGGERW